MIKHIYQKFIKLRRITDESPIPNILHNFKGWVQHYNAISSVFEQYINDGYIKKEDVFDSHCMDFGGSHGQLAWWLLINGAKEVTVLDLYIPENVFINLHDIDPRFNFSSEKIESYSQVVKEYYDFVFAFTVTEHVSDLKSVFASIYSVLKPGGVIFIVHDNYYHPSGHHDNIMLSVDERGVYEYIHKKCWNNTLKCEATNDIRRSMSHAPLPLWSDASETTCNPARCFDCNFYKRSRPWSHLLHRNEFTRVFPEKAFSFNNLNKITPFLLKQHLQEAGFTIELWKRTYVNNHIPEELKNIDVFEEDLKTVNIVVKACK